MMGIENHASYTKILIDVRLIEVKKITLFVDGHPAVDVDLELGTILFFCIFLPKVAFFITLSHEYANEADWCCPTIKTFGKTSLKNINQARFCFIVYL